MRRLPFTFIPFALLAGAVILGAEPSRPEFLKLKVSTHSGPMPLDLKLTGSLAGVDLSAGECFIRWDRTYETPAHQVLQQREEFPCQPPVAPAGGKTVGDVFERKLTLEEPGDYSIRIVFKQADGHQVAGTTQEVKVYRGKIEVGVTGTYQHD